jgi:hypothetical protein
MRMSAKRPNSKKASLEVVALPMPPEAESVVSSSVMAYFSPSGDFRFECDFKSTMERDALLFRVDAALSHLRSRIAAQITPSLNLAA